jgi:hypothetical protein
MTRISSKPYLAGSRGASCKFRIPGVCNGDPATVVPCHGRDRYAGGASKASDLSVVDGCFECHDRIDRRRPMPDGELISEADYNFYVLRGLQETLEARIDLGLLIVKGAK